MNLKQSLLIAVVVGLWVVYSGAILRLYPIPHRTPLWILTRQTMMVVAIAFVLASVILLKVAGESSS